MHCIKQPTVQKTTKCDNFNGRIRQVFIVYIGHFILQKVGTSPERNRTLSHSKSDTELIIIQSDTKDGNSADTEEKGDKPEEGGEEKVNGEADQKGRVSDA